jgi:hypothetical protein
MQKSERRPGRDAAAEFDLSQPEGYRRGPSGVVVLAG